MPKPTWIAALVAVVCAAPRAQDCFTNLVPNGDFEAVIRDPWVLSPAGAATGHYGLAAVDGSFRSRCIELRYGTAPFSLAQPVPFPLVAGQVYELAFDVEGGGCCADVELGLTPSGGARLPVVAERLGVERRRVTARFVATAAGDHVLDLTVRPSAAGYLRFDSVLVRQVPLVFSFVGPRPAGGVAQFRIDGPPGLGYAVLFGVDGVFDRPWPILPCAGGLWLRLPVEPFWIGRIGAAGSDGGSIPVPESLRGLPLFFQPVTLAQPCDFGCPQVYAFR
jgi:hypothetical protein